MVTYEISRMILAMPSCWAWCMSHYCHAGPWPRLTGPWRLRPFFFPLRRLCYVCRYVIVSEIWISKFHATFQWTTHCRFTTSLLHHHCSSLVLRGFTVVSYKSENFSFIWELLACNHPPSFLRKERAKQAALILGENSHFNRMPLYLDQSLRSGSWMALVERWSLTMTRRNRWRGV